MVIFLEAIKKAYHWKYCLELQYSLYRPFPNYRPNLQDFLVLTYSSCSRYFQTIWWLLKFSFHHKWNEAWLLLINWYIRVVEGLRLTQLGNIRKISKFHIKLLASTQCSFQNEYFVSTSRNWIFPVVHHFTWKLVFVSNILWMIVDKYVKLLLKVSPKFSSMWVPLGKMC